MSPARKWRDTMAGDEKRKELEMELAEFERGDQAKGQRATAR